MLKGLLKDASLYSMSSFLARGFSLITVPIYTRILTPADYGALDLLLSLTLFAPTIIGACLDQAVARFYIAEKDINEKKKIASTVIFYNAIALVIIIPLAMTASGFLSISWLDGQVSAGTVMLFFGYIVIHNIYYVANNQLKYLFLAKKFAICAVGNTIVSTALSLLFIVYFRWGVFGIFLGWTISQAIFAILSLYFGREAYALTFSTPLLRKMLHYSMPLIPGSIAFFAIQWVDRYAINEFHGLAAAGIYGIGARLASLVKLFLMGFQGAWNPFVMKHFPDDGAGEIFQRVFNYFLFATISIMMFLSLFGKEALLVLTTAEFSAGFVVVPLLVLSALLSSVGGYFTFGIQIAQKTRLRLYLNVGVLFVNIALNLALIPILGIVGAALATALSYMCMAIVGMIISQRLYPVPYRWGRIIGASIIGMVVSNSVVVFEFNSLPLKAFLFISCVLILSRLLNVRLDPGEFSRLLGRKSTGRSG